MRARHLCALAVGTMLAACTGSDEPEVETSAAVDSVALAVDAYDPAVFDTLTWETDEAAVERGAVVFSYSCARCHGMRGFGDGGFVSGGDTLRPPSFHQADWRFAEDTAGLRQMIFTGGEQGMPHWGLVGLKYRDVDAVSRYILERLRTR